jgi:alpha-amylase
VYEKLLKLRKDFDCIKFGDTEVFEDTFPKNILAFKRNYQSQSALVLINFSKKNYRIDIPDGYSKVVFSTETVEIMPGSEILLKGYQGVVLLNRS